MTSGSGAGLARFVGTPPTPALLQSLLYLKGLPLEEIGDLLQANSLVIEFSPGDELTRQDDAAEWVLVWEERERNVFEIGGDQI